MDHLASIPHACLLWREREKEILSSVSALTILKPSSSSFTHTYIYVCTPLDPPNNHANGQFSRNSPSPIEDYRGLSCRDPPVIFTPRGRKEQRRPNVGENDMPLPLFLFFFLPFFLSFSVFVGGKRGASRLGRVWVWTNKRGPMERGSTL